MSRGLRFVVCVACAWGVTACGGAPRAAQWEAADGLMHSDARWLGADVASSIDLGGDRTLWLFGDTFVARTSAGARAESVMVRNTVAVQSGRDPTRATITFHWRGAEGGAPASYFPEVGPTWHWPGHGVRIPSGPLVVFLSAIRAKAGGGVFGFEAAGWRVGLIDDPDRTPEEWTPRFVEGAGETFGSVPGAAVVRDGGYVVSLSPRSVGEHDAYLVRFAEDALRAGTIAAQWWTGTGWSASGPPVVVLPAAGTECSVHFDARAGRWIHVTSRGFGATTIAMRTAERLEGPWGPSTDVFVPPESRGRRPLVYAAKAHPELATLDPRDLVVTYATNSFDFASLLAPEGAATYWPRFVRVRMR